MNTKPSQKFLNTLSTSLRQAFSLNEEAPVSDELISLYLQGAATHNFSIFAQHIAPIHSDKFTIHISHDVDWLNPHHPYSYVNVVRALFGKHTWLSLKQTLRSDIFIRNIEQLLALESQLGINAIFCLGAQTGTQLGRYDIRYALNAETTKEAIRLIQSKHHQIGLQSSYYAHRRNTIPKQKLMLEKATQQKVTVHRSHYLHAPQAVLYKQLNAAGIQYDIGHGSARKAGLKNGFPGKFKPIDSHTGELTDLTVIPLILMDNAFFHSSYHRVINDFKQVLKKVKAYNGSACISFHPENMILKPQLYSYFEEIIHICMQEGANINPSLT